MSKKKIIFVAFFFSSIFAIFAYLFINQSYLLNNYKFKQQQKHVFSEKPLTIVSSNEVFSLSPDVVDLESKMRIYGNIYEGLVALDKNNNIIPALAISWWNIDDLNWEYKLRRGVKFHDGADFTADDVIRVYNEVMNQADSQLKPFFVDIAKIEKIDKYKIRVTTKKPAPQLNQKINALLISKAQNIWTGPYRFVSFSKEKGLELEAFESYWWELPHLRKVVFQTINNKNERIQLFGEGKIDILTAVPTSNTEIFSQKIKTVPSLEVSFLLFNQSSELWKDIVIRKIASMVIDHNMIAQLLGQYSRSVNQFISPGVFGYSLGIKENKYDPEEARNEIIKIFGQEWRKTTLDLTADYKKIGEYIQKEFKKINIKVELNFVSPQVLIEKIKNKSSDMYILGWQSESGDAGDILNSMFLDGAQLNSIFVAGSPTSQQISKLILESNLELNQKKRLGMLQKIMENLVDEETVGIPLFEGARIYAVQSGVNFEPRVDGMIVLKNIQYFK